MQTYFKGHWNKDIQQAKTKHFNTTNNIAKTLLHIINTTLYSDLIKYPHNNKT